MMFDSSASGYENGQQVPIVQPEYETLEEIFRRCKQNRSESIGIATDAWREILMWVINPEGKDNVRFTRGCSAIIRIYAVAWSVCPEMFEGVTQEQMAKRLGVSFRLFSFYVVEFSTAFGFRSRGMKSPQARENARMARLRSVRQQKAREVRAIWQ